jgi:hypothetical protein
LIAQMLRYDATMQAEVGDLAGALETVKATIHVGRSFGDEPSAMSEFTRLFCIRQSLFALERTLARGEPATAELESLQHLLEEEAEHPAQLNSARADRAVIHQFLLVAESLGIDRANYQLRASPLGYRFDNIVDMIKAKQVHAKYLHFLTACVEIAKLPAHEQASKFADLGKAPGLLPALLEGMRRGEEPERIRKIFHNSRAYLLSAVVAVAMERYRRAEGRWPDDLDALVPKYLSGVPIDPFQGKPLQLVRTKGPSGEFWTIRGPEIAEENPTLRILPRLWALKYFRLWDVKDRGKPATTENNKPEMGGAGTSGNW